MGIRRFFIFAFFLFICPFSASAAVYYPPTVYVRPDPSYQNSQALGNLLSALIQASNQNAQAERDAKQQRELQNFINGVRQSMKEMARNEANFYAKSASEYGVPTVIKAMIEYNNKKGIYSEVGSKNNTDYLFCENQVKDLPKVVWLIAFDKEYNQCRFNISIPEWNLEERHSTMFTEPRQTSYPQSVSEYLGFVTSNQIVGKNGHFGLIVNDLTRGGIADSAGIKRGDMITQIDTYPLKGRSIQQLTSYLVNRITQKARVSIKVVRGKSVEYANIQF